MNIISEINSLFDAAVRTVSTPAATQQTPLQQAQGLADVFVQADKAYELHLNSSPVFAAKLQALADQRNEALKAAKANAAGFPSTAIGPFVVSKEPVSVPPATPVLGMVLLDNLAVVVDDNQRQNNALINALAERVAFLEKGWDALSPAYDTVDGLLRRIVALEKRSGKYTLVFQDIHDAVTKEIE